MSAMYWHIIIIDASSYEEPDGRNVKSIVRNDCIWKVYFQYVFWNDESIHRIEQNAIHSLPMNIYKAFHLISKL